MARRSIPRERWNEIQQGEWAYHEQKDPSSILEINLRYWRRILSALPESVGIEQTKRALDLGCGGCGILLAVPPGDHVGVDPLMASYLEKFPFLAERKDIRWVAGTAEDLDKNELFDTVFLINSLDHVFDPDEVLNKAKELVKPGGHIVILLNCHNTSFFRWYFATFYRYIDSHHPFHFRPADVVKKLDEFESLCAEEIDRLWFPDEEEYERKVLKVKKKNSSKLLKKALNPFFYPIAVSRYLLGRPTRRRNLNQKSIISIYLFAFRKASN